MYCRRFLADRRAPASGAERPISESTFCSAGAKLSEDSVSPSRNTTERPSGRLFCRVTRSKPGEVYVGHLTEPLCRTRQAQTPEVSELLWLALRRQKQRREVCKPDDSWHVGRHVCCAAYPTGKPCNPRDRKRRCQGKPLSLPKGWAGRLPSGWPPHQGNRDGSRSLTVSLSHGGTRAPMLRSDSESADKQQPGRARGKTSRPEQSPDRLGTGVYKPIDGFHVRAQVLQNSVAAIRSRKPVSRSARRESSIR